jgi:predicted DNA-binding protein (MmcQ/YjbR family)
MVIIGEISAMKKRTSRTSKMSKAVAALRGFALGYPGAREDFPWGERVIKVGKKVFVFMGMADGDGLGLSVKLPASGPMALLLPFATPTGYGLGKSGWVSARFAPSDDPPLGLLREWIDESYRAVAPKTAIAKLPPTDVKETARRTGPRAPRPSGKWSSRSTARGR